MKKQVVINVAEAVRQVLENNRNISASEAMASIEETHGVQLNKNSFSVAFYTARKKLGGGKRRSRRRKTHQIGRRDDAVIAATSQRSSAVDMDRLRETAKFVSEVGGFDAAITAVKNVEALQIA